MFTDFTTLVGIPCWAVLAGSGTGSIFHLYLGAKKLRATPISNEHILAAARTHAPTHSVYVCCSWRLSTIEKIICTCRSDNSNEGPMVSGLKLLVGERVTEVSVDEKTLDAVFYFTSGLALSIFNDVELNDRREAAAYSVTEIHKSHHVIGFTLQTTVDDI